MHCCRVLFLMSSRWVIHCILRILWGCLQISFPTFSYFINTFLRYCSFYNNCISSCCINSCCSLLYLTWFSANSSSLHVWVCLSNEILVCSYPIYVRSIFPCACMSCKFCRYPCIRILCKCNFHVLLNSFDHI